MTTETKGIESLRKAVDKDLQGSSSHDYEAKFEWVLDRAQHYAEVFGVEREEILKHWEQARNYWYMNYYQDANQPLLNTGNVKMFENLEDAKESFEGKGFRCPKCEKESSDPYECSQEKCDWKIYGLFRDMSKGVHIGIKDRLIVQNLFKPIAWEKR